MGQLYKGENLVMESGGGYSAGTGINIDSCGAICNTGVTSVNGCTGAVTLNIPTDNCQLGNSCGYTTCTGTLVPNDLNGYTKSCDLCTVATSGKYCDLSGKPTIPTDNCQLANSCGYTTCTGTLTSSSLKTVNGNSLVGSGDVCIQGGVTSVNGCTGAVTLTIPTNNNQLTNGCGYTTCTGTLSSCSDVISALGYTPYNSSNPSGYTTCTGTVGVSSQANNTLTAGALIRAGTEANFTNLTKDSNTVYLAY